MTLNKERMIFKVGDRVRCAGEAGAIEKINGAIFTIKFEEKVNLWGQDCCAGRGFDRWDTIASDLELIEYKWRKL